MPMWNEKEESLDLEERAQQQWERLQSTLNRAYKNVPFYRNRFDRQKIDLSQMETREDLAGIPFTGREHFSENYPYGLFAVPLRDVVRIHTAQGTGLRPVVSGYTRQDLHVWRELVARALSASGVTRLDILQIDLDPGLTNWGRDYKDGAECTEAGVIPLTLLPPEKQLMVMRDYRTSVLVTTPSAAEQLAELLFQSRLNPNELSLRTLILVGEAPRGALQDQLEEQLHVKSWVHYGLSEVPGPAIAFECEERLGLHISEDHFFAEVVDPATGVPLPDGEEGELVLTTLTTKAFPLIRFRTGDRVKFLEGSCPCGRTLRRMQWLPRRTDDMLIIRGVKIHHHQILLFLERSLGFIPRSYRFLIKRHQLRDFLEIWVKVDEEIFSDEIKEMERFSRQLCAEMNQELGIPVQIRLKEGASFDPHWQTNRLEDLR
ncbi:MAG: phenylacetate--CoA ligase [Deltaproteobacteria bacterium]|nr:phenylacetate--CoA ligase [Deltaproteobacteria bacterium]